MWDGIEWSVRMSDGLLTDSLLPQPGATRLYFSTASTYVAHEIARSGVPRAGITRVVNLPQARGGLLRFICQLVSCAIDRRDLVEHMLEAKHHLRITWVAIPPLFTTHDSSHHGASSTQERHFRSRGAVANRFREQL